MGLNISLIVHGVPHGHKIWNASEGDKKYIETFYGSTYDKDEQMTVERMNSFMYYTFVRGQRVMADDGRGGSYLALTLRMDAYYADVQNMYNILRAAYQKTFVGQCVAENGGTAKYLISDFSQIDAKLKEAEKRIIDYISYFSQSTDLINLNAFRPSTGGATTRFNLQECSAQAASNAIKASGRLMVSPFFPSAQMEKELEKFRKEAADAHRQAQKDIAAAKQEAEQQLAQAQQQTTQSQSQLKKREQEMHTQIDILQQEKASLQKQMKEVEAQTARRYDQELRDCKSQVTRLEEILSKIADALTGFKQPKDYDEYGQGKPEPPRGHNKFSIFDLIKGGLVVLLLIVFLGMGGYLIHSQNRTAQAIEALVAKTDSLSAETDTLPAQPAPPAEMEEQEQPTDSVNEKASYDEPQD